MTPEEFLFPLAIWIWSTLNSLFIYLDRMTLSLWASVSNPVKALSLLGDLSKFSLGPTLAFVLSQWAFRREEKQTREKEREERRKTLAAVRTMITIELEHNEKMLKRDRELLSKSIDDATGDEHYPFGLKTSLELFSQSHHVRKSFLSIGSELLYEAFDTQELTDLFGLYERIYPLLSNVYFRDMTLMDIEKDVLDEITTIEERKKRNALLKEMMEIRSTKEKDDLDSLLRRERLMQLQNNDQTLEEELETKEKQYSQTLKRKADQIFIFLDIAIEDNKKISKILRQNTKNLY
ncbi:hypothetical protein [Halomicronema sp. CCY15110]|uniref:hypothetical protein n=1 Tax=Halomicronema sp. CCY15110 TaxID=2767773 RepID=UPI0019500FB4|nr:hypothetical protein [Halomicronema sp. CCY15110]